MQKIIPLLIDKDIIYSSIKVAIVVGTLLNLINQGDAMLSLNSDYIHWPKLIFTYMVPYMVSTYAAVRIKLNYKS